MMFETRAVRPELMPPRVGFLHAHLEAELLS